MCASSVRNPTHPACFPRPCDSIHQQRHFLRSEGVVRTIKRDAHHCLAGPVVVVVAFGLLPVYLQQMLTKRYGRLCEEVTLGRVERLPLT
jgi:hypothetical protein